MPRFFGWRYKNFYETGNVELAGRNFSCDNFLCENFCAFFSHDNVKKHSNAIFEKTVGSFGILTQHNPPLSGPCASFWIYGPKLYLDSKWVKIVIFVKFWLFFFHPRNRHNAKKAWKTRLWEKNFSPFLSPSKMMDLNWSFRWGYGKYFLSNCCFKKRCVDSTPSPPRANRVNGQLITVSCNYFNSSPV